MKPEMKAEFAIYGETIPPEEITRLLGITPTMTWKKGELIPHTIAKRKITSWRYAVLANDETYNLGDLVEQLVNIFSPKAAMIKDICKRYNHEVEFACGVDIVDDTPGIYLSPEVIAGIGLFEASLDVDIILTE